MKNLLLIFTLLVTHSLFSQDFEQISKQLEQIEKQSLTLRSKVMPTIKEFGFDSPEMDSLDAQILQFDSSSLVLVASILDKYGWLNKKEVGESGNNTLFLVIQHAQDNAIRKKYFPLLEESARKGESELWAMATMKDRILVQDGKPQIYGTQLRMVDGILKVFEIEDEKNVNKRRKAVGLGKMK